MGNERDLLEGIAVTLAAAGVGAYPKPVGGYTGSQVPIYFGQLPAAPDRVIALNTYSPTDDPSLPYSRFRVQVMMRGAANAARDVGDLADAVFGVLHNLQAVQMGGVYVIEALRTANSGPLGTDDNGRMERADNYVFDVNTPVTQLRRY